MAILNMKNVILMIQIFIRYIFILVQHSIYSYKL